MNTISSAELSRMQSYHDQTLFDTCVIQTCSESQDSAGEMIRSYTDGSAIACGFKPAGGKERRRANGDIMITDASVRLPISTTVNAKDRIKITKRHGVSLTTAQVFEVVGLPQRGPSGIVVELEAIS